MSHTSTAGRPRVIDYILIDSFATHLVHDAETTGALCLGSDHKDVKCLLVLKGKFKRKHKYRQPGADRANWKQADLASFATATTKELVSRGCLAEMMPDDAGMQHMLDERASNIEEALKKASVCSSVEGSQSDCRSK